MGARIGRDTHAVVLEQIVQAVICEGTVSDDDLLRFSDEDP